MGDYAAGANPHLRTKANELRKEIQDGCSPLPRGMIV